jgi:hypothetical protein
LGHSRLLRSEGKDSKALLATGGEFEPEVAVARNVTALAKGDRSFGIEAVNSSPVAGGSMTLDLKNAISSGDGADLAAGGSGPSKLVVTNSNFDSAEPFGGGTISAASNETAPPLFVNAAAGDYREAAGSPTIDAGSNDQIGATDLEGSPRSQGAAPDIGAFEFVPPAPAVATIDSLSVEPQAFRTANVGGALISGAKGPRPPVGTTVAYALSGPAAVNFSVERAARGRRVGGRCAKQTGSNRDHKKCKRLIQMKGSFSVAGASGSNRFRFSGRLGGKALKPGPYQLVGQAGSSIKRARFKIVR